LNATVRFKPKEDRVVVVLEGRNLAEAFTLYMEYEDDNGNPVLWRDRLSEIQIPVEDLSDAKRVARAFSYLIVTLGGRSSSL
jgi:hypothetical protein